MSESDYAVGVARYEITPDCIGVGMLGWGDSDQRVRGVKAPLYARATVITHPATKGRLIHVCAEVCFITEALREGVMEVLNREHEALAIRSDELLLVATHTHNAPGGHSRYLLYNLTVPGFQPAVFESYRDGIVRAVVEAFRVAAPAVLRLGTAAFEPVSKVAFNRSLESWRRNPDANPGEEVDRRMTVLRIDRPDGRAVGCITWFAVHCTSVHRDFHYIHSDNKGIAAVLFEEQERAAGTEDFVATFAQGAAGDVTPNFMYHRGCRDLRGPFPEDEKSCEFNARLQYELARKIYEGLAKEPLVSGPIRSRLELHDFSRIEPLPEFTGGRTGMRTGPATIGCNFMRGTAEGRGTPEFMVIMAKLVSRAATYVRYLGILLRGRRVPPPWKLDPVQGPKIAFMETGRGRVLGASRMVELVLPGWLHPTIATLKKLGRAFRGRDRFAFTPQILPVQVVTLGSLALVAVPAEFTTMSGKRLAAVVLAGLRKAGIDQVLISGYANAYSGYVTTCEEYQVQAYEGASTHFGMWTLAGYQTVFKGLLERFGTSRR